jgi:hypothetical protein
MDARKRSFSNWVAERGLPPVDELITLGFFYAGLRSMLFMNYL